MEKTLKRNIMRTVIVPLLFDRDNKVLTNEYVKILDKYYHLWSLLIFVNFIKNTIVHIKDI